MEILVNGVNNVSNLVFSLGQVDITFANLVLCRPWLCSITLKPITHFFMQSDHLNWYKQHYSLAQEEPMEI